LLGSHWVYGDALVYDGSLSVSLSSLQIDL
jgi:hypothetical protein